MKTRSLSTRILMTSALILLLFGGAGFGVLYQAQMQLAARAMDSLLKNGAFALSALVSSRPDGQFDFEITPLALSDYGNRQTGEFFRFLDPRTDHIFRESVGAPKAGCSIQNAGSRVGRIEEAGQVYRVRSVVFQPETDGDFKGHSASDRKWICLIIGVNVAPYQDLVYQTLKSTVPILMVLVLVSMGALLVMVRNLTRDLSQLTVALQTADFGATHEFPELPEAQTAEVKAVIDRLQGLHHQAADVYRDMWLFLGRAAHQIKTPVAAIQATLQVLLRKERSKEELILGLTDVGSAVELLSVLTKKLISSSRVSYELAPRLEPVDLLHFFQTQLKVFRAQAEQRSIVIRLEPQGSPQVLGHASLLSELFGNLIENAILYSPVGTEVVLAWKRNANQVQVTVRDQGPGFPEGVRRSLFEPFTRGDERLASGSGLGLSIAKKSAKLLGGDVFLQETSALGSVVSVILPTPNT